MISVIAKRTLTPDLTGSDTDDGTKWIITLPSEEEELNYLSPPPLTRVSYCEFELRLENISPRSICSLVLLCVSPPRCRKSHLSAVGRLCFYGRWLNKSQTREQIQSSLAFSRSDRPKAGTNRFPGLADQNKRKGATKQNLCLKRRDNTCCFFKGSSAHRER